MNEAISFCVPGCLTNAGKNDTYEKIIITISNDPTKRSVEHGCGKGAVVFAHYTRQLDREYE